MSYHDHSGKGAREALLAALADGQSVAYGSEAGMPLIADPGYDLSRAAAAAGHRVTVAPGASAALAALTLGGLATDAFFFNGFLPNAMQARRTRLAALADIPGTLVFYESPNRIAAMLDDAAEVLGGDRPAALCRELTKKFEEVRRDSLDGLRNSVVERPPKGEIVVLIDRARSESVKEAELEEDIRQAVTKMSVKDAADLVSRAHGLPRRKVYQLALALAKEG
jgi:16S rRNA (cytidine1402-2'-O)-methyltransferase